MGQLTVQEPDAFFHVISRDKGFDLLIKHLKNQGVFAARSELIEAMPCFCVPKAVPEPAPKLKPVSAPPKAKVNPVDEAEVRAVIADLIGRKGSRPGTVKTLLNTIRAKLGKQSVEDIQSIYNALRKRGLIVEKGTKVSYALPKSA